MSEETMDSPRIKAIIARQERIMDLERAVADARDRVDRADARFREAMADCERSDDDRRRAQNAHRRAYLNLRHAERKLEEGKVL